MNTEAGEGGGGVLSGGVGTSGFRNSGQRMRRTVRWRPPGPATCPPQIPSDCRQGPPCNDSADSGKCSAAVPSATCCAILPHSTAFFSAPLSAESQTCARRCAFRRISLFSATLGLKISQAGDAHSRVLCAHPYLERPSKAGQRRAVEADLGGGRLGAHAVAHLQPQQRRQLPQSRLQRLLPLCLQVLGEGATTLREQPACK